MSIARKLYDAGFEDLVSVMPPDAKLSSTSKIDPSQRGKCPGLRAPDGSWYGYPFTTKFVVPDSIDNWGANIGLRGDNFPGLDIDVDHPGLAQAIKVQAFKQLGGAPTRRSVGSRLLLPYSTEEPFARMALKIKYQGEDHMVEVLGKGRQYVVHGGHPSGSQYVWEDGALWDHESTDLQPITKEKVEDFFDHLINVLGDRAECRKVGDGKTSSDKAPPQEDLLAPSLEALTTLVESIPNPGDWGWDEMVEFGYAVKAAGAHDDSLARGLFLAWCAKWEGGNDTDTDVRNWESFQPPSRVGWSWLQDKAREVTKYEPATDIFDADPEAKAPPPESNVSLTDEWAVQRIMPDLRERLRYVHATGQWYTWEQYRWKISKGLAYEAIIRDHLRRLCLYLKDVAASIPDKKDAAPYKAASMRFQNLRGIEAVVKLARGRLSEDIEDFDKDPLVLNTPGGVVNLLTSKVTSSRKEDLLSRSTAVAPVEGDMPLFSKFVRDLTGGDADLVSFIQRYMGYCLTGDTSEKVLAFAWGSDSDTGKSTFVRVMSLLFGDYADSVDVEAFITARTGGRIPDDIARLPGARLVTATEPSTGQHWDEKTIKAITGGDEISARFMRQSWFTFKPQFKILVVGNVQPELKNVDSAMLRRVMIVPMNHTVAREDQIEDLAERLIEEEGPQILHWLIQGCLARASGGLNPPEAVIAQTDNYKDTQDIISQWLKEECEFSKDGGTEFDTARRDLYSQWRIWCKGGDHDPGGEKTFKVEMDSRAREFGFESVARVGPKDARKRGYRGIRLTNAINGGFE